MDSAVAKNAAEPRSVDPVWTNIREAAQKAAASEPVLAGLLHATILSQTRFEGALSYHLARLAGTTEVPAALIRQTLDEALNGDPAIGMAARADIMAVVERDPACTSHLDPLLWFKGYHALQTSRVAHWLWLQGRQTLAHFLQSRASALFGLDIHPGARIGKGIFIDHGTGVVIGETAVVEDGVSMLHGVTLGGTLAPARSAAIAIPRFGAACCWAPAPRCWATSRSVPAPRSRPAASCSSRCPPAAPRPACRRASSAVSMSPSPRSRWISESDLV
jgi:serine O-acetyltransferase